MNYTGIENALYTYLYKSAFAIIDQYTRGEAARQLREMFQVYIDLINVSRIVRLKAVYQEGPDFIRSTLLPFGTIHPHLLDEMLDAEPEDVLNILAKAPIGKRCQKDVYKRQLQWRGRSHFPSHWRCQRNGGYRMA